MKQQIIDYFISYHSRHKEVKGTVWNSPPTERKLILLFFVTSWCLVVTRKDELKYYVMENPFYF